MSSKVIIDQYGYVLGGIRTWVAIIASLPITPPALKYPDFKEIAVPSLDVQNFFWVAGQENCDFQKMHSKPQK